MRDRAVELFDLLVRQQSEQPVLLAVAAPFLFLLACATLAFGCTSGSRGQPAECSPPPTIAPESRPAEMVEWIGRGGDVSGENGIFVILPLYPTTPVQAGDPIEAKLPWFLSSETADLEIEITSLGENDSPGLSARAAVPGGYPVPGVHPSTVSFSGPGCFRVTARAGTQKFEFNLEVPDP